MLQANLGIQYDLCPYKQIRTHMHMYPREDHMKIQWESDHVQTKERGLKIHQNRQHSTLDFQYPELWEYKFLLLKPLTCGILLWQP